MHKTYYFWMFQITKIKNNSSTTDLINRENIDINQVE